MNYLTRKIYEVYVRAQKRYTPFTTHYPGFQCAVLDKSSFLGMCSEILDREIYKFSTDAQKPYIIDCGANIGLSVIYFKRLYPAAEVIAFEPDPVVADALKKNITAAKLEGVTVIEKALGAKEETLSFFSEKADGGRIALADDNADIITVEAIRLSPFLDKQVDFLKIDIEGAESDVLEECRAKLSNVQNLFIEYHSVASKKQDLDKILSILTEAGFRYYIEDACTISEHPYIVQGTHSSFDMQLNIFAYRPK